MSSTDHELQNLTREELIAAVLELRARHGQETDQVGQLSANLAVHQTELLVQHEELRQAATLLQASRDEYAELFDFAPVAYLNLSPTGIILAANLTACGLLAVERARCIGLPLSGFVRPRDRQALLDHLRECRHPNRFVRTDLSVVSRTGQATEVELLSKASAMREGPRLTLRTALLDLTERRVAEGNIHSLNAELEAANSDLRREMVQRRQAERRTRESEEREAARARELEQLAASLQEADRQKDAFLAMLAHELRNPLGPLRNAVDVWRMYDPVGGPMAEMQDVMERQVVQLTRLVDDLLDISRIASGKIRLRSEVIDLLDIVQQVVKDHRGEFQAAGQNLAINVGEGPVWILGDRARMAQALGNLLQNSRKFSDAGGHTEVRLEQDDQAGQAVLSVRDTGIGMEPETIRTVFQPFTQADRSLDRSRGGLGLGLSLVRGLVELQGGSIQAESPGLHRGSCFVIRMPLSREAAAQPRAWAAGGAEAHLYKVLVIDDRRDAMLTVSRMLSRLGHEVREAQSAEEGLSIAKCWRPDVIISDIGLPGTDGYTLARLVRADDNLRRAKLIALSGYGTQADQARARESGFNHHLTKPASLDEIRAALEQVSGAPSGQ
jgi:signal transduction histidine kinase/ActR/RegA family two-component response regulator